MRKTAILCLILLELLLAVPVASAQTAPEPKNILIIFSLSPGLPAYEIALEKMTKRLLSRVAFGKLDKPHARQYGGQFGCYRF